MPPFEQMDRLQRAAYWPPAGTTEAGEKAFGPVRAVHVRWEEVAAVSVDANGAPVTFSNVAFTLAAEDVRLNGALRLCPGFGPADGDDAVLASLQDAADPFSNTGPKALMIRRLERTPSLDRRQQTVKAYM